MSHPTRFPRPRWQAAMAVGAALFMGLSACSDDPFAFDWDDTPDTVLLYSLARPQLNLVSGFSFYRGQRVEVEAPGSTGVWDAALDTRDPDLVLLPPGALGVSSTARIAALDGVALEDVTRAPADSLVYVADEPVVVRMGTTYVIRTNRTVGSFGTRCSYYAKMEAVTIDVAGGSLRFRYVVNPVCNSQDLVPPN